MKKLLPLLAVAALGAALVGCKSGDDAAATPTDTTKSSTATPPADTAAKDK